MYYIYDNSQDAESHIKRVDRQLGYPVVNKTFVGKGKHIEGITITHAEIITEGDFKLIEKDKETEKEYTNKALMIDNDLAKFKKKQAGKVVYNLFYKKDTGVLGSDKKSKDYFTIANIQDEIKKDEIIATVEYFSNRGDFLIQKDGIAVYYTIGKTEGISSLKLVLLLPIHTGFEFVGQFDLDKLPIAPPPKISGKH